VVLTCTFWALFFLPGYAFVRRFWPAPREAGLLYTLGLGYAASLLVISPVSLLCYWAEAPLHVFSAACALAIGLALPVLIRGRADRELWALAKREPLVPILLLAGLLWLQARTGGWLDGDATFHLGRMRVLLEHGFTNRDIYLAQYHFQHVYHTNLLFPLYASAAQLTGQSYLETWFYTEAWAKLLVAAGHYVFGYALTRQRFAAWLLALCVITANAGETYTLYPNTLCVGYLLPMLLGIGLSFAGRRDGGVCTIAALAALDGLLAQIHALYAVYAALMLAPVLALSLLQARGVRERWLVLLAIASLGVAAPFVFVSTHAFRSEIEIPTAPDELETPIPVAPAPGLAYDQPMVVVRPALAAGGGHLEKVLDAVDEDHVVFNPRRMGGRAFVLAGFAALCAAWFLRRSQRVVMANALVVALLLAGMLFTVSGASAALRVLQTPFVVARLSTVLSVLLLFGACACIAALIQPIRTGRVWAEALVTLLLVAAATRLLGQAPMTFNEHVESALATESERHARLDRLETRRALLAQTVPSGATILTTGRFARQVVMLRDCYVVAADRGHTGILGIGKRRRDVTVLNAADTPWAVRAKLIDFYGLQLAVFEHRWQRRYRWAYEHGRVLGSAAGLDVVELRL
jgi:hypothetical protein